MVSHCYYQSPWCREAIINKKTGFTVPIKNPLILSKYIQKILDNKELRMKMGKEARILQKKIFIDKVVEKHLNIYSSIM